MKIATVRELKNNENRVGLTPDNVREYVRHGHSVTIETGAGLGSGFSDEAYSEAGADIETDAAAVWGNADLLIKVKEPLPEEYGYLRHDLILFTYLHLAANEELTRALLDSGCTAVAYETIRDQDGMLPLLKPMSEIAGRLAVISGSYYLQKSNGGSGVLLGSMPGLVRPRVAILGAGAAGAAALRLAEGIGADCQVLDINLARLAELDTEYSGKITTIHSTPESIEAALTEADLVIGTVLIPGARAPKLIKREYLKNMKPGSVIVDVAIDQGGCTEVSRPTTYDEPVYIVDGIVMYCVANMPGSVPYSSTLALTNATLAYGLAIADKGLAAAIDRFPGLLTGINIHNGQVTLESIANAFDMTYEELEFSHAISN